MKGGMGRRTANFSNDCLGGLVRARSPLSSRMRRLHYYFYVYYVCVAVDVELECLGNIGFGFDVRVTIEFPTGCAAEAKEGPASAPPIYSM